MNDGRFIATSALRDLVSDEEQQKLYNIIKPPYDPNVKWVEPIKFVNETILKMTSKVCAVHKEVHFLRKSLAFTRAECDNPATLKLFDQATQTIEKARDAAQYRFDVFANQWRELVEVISTAPQHIAYSLFFKRYSSDHADRLARMVFKDLRTVLDATYEASNLLKNVKQNCYLD